MLNPGNELLLLQIYLGMTVFKWMWSLLPGVFVGLLFAAYYQFKKKIDRYLDPLIYKIKVKATEYINKLLVCLPRHQSIKTLPPTLSYPVLKKHE